MSRGKERSIVFLVLLVGLLFYLHHAHHPQNNTTKTQMVAIQRYINGDLKERLGGMDNNLEYLRKRVEPEVTAQEEAQNAAIKKLLEPWPIIPEGVVPVKFTIPEPEAGGDQ
jgi:hypothetical protein